MFGVTFRRIFFALSVFAAASLPVSAAGTAEYVPKGSYLRGTTDQALMPEPRGRFRTRLAWLIASQIAFKQARSSTSIGIFESITANKFDRQLRAQADAFAALKGDQHYAYSDALVRDLARLKIQLEEDNQFKAALWTFGEGVMADIAAEVLMSGVSKLLPKGSADVPDLGSSYLTKGTEAEFAYRRALQDMELRYRMVIDRSLFDEMEAKLVEGAVTAADVRELVSGSALSALIGMEISAFSQNPQQSFEVLRQQLVLDVAAHGCACALRPVKPDPAHQILGSIFGSSANFRTQLAFLLSQELAPKQWSPFGSLLGMLPQVNAQAIYDLTLQERRKIAGWKKNNPDAFATHLRSLLVDIETLERLQLEALESGAGMTFIEGTALNILFGVVAGVVVPGPEIAATIVSTVANAAFGAHVNDQTTTEAIKIRLHMAALREETLDSLMKVKGNCGCGVGVPAVPKRAVRGARSPAQ